MSRENPHSRSTTESPRVFIIMGVSGAGKTLIGTMLAERLRCPFFDADNYHSEANRGKMAAGTPLTDDDRMPWLYTLRGLIEEERRRSGRLVLACSALKHAYRKILRGPDNDLCFVYLKGPPELIAERLKLRKGHYMNPVLLASQFETLEEPTSAIEIDVSNTPEEIVAQIMAK